MEPNVTIPERAPSLLRMLDAALQIGLVALLIFACSRIILPFTGILLWSVILAVMLYPLHQRFVIRVGNRWSATLIGLISVTLMLVPLVMVVTSLGSSILEFVSGLQDSSLTVPPPPPWLADLPLVGKKLTETWVLIETNMPAALTKYGKMLGGIASSLASFASSSPMATAPQNSLVACWNVSPAARHKAPGWLR
jgi:predicted PurR-regulated permease PerM